MNGMKLSVVALMVSNAMVLSAQTQAVEGPPKAPFVMKTPESGTWTIAIDAPRLGAPTSEATLSPLGEKVEVAFPVSVVVTKTGEVVSEVWNYRDGSTSQRWAFRGAQIEQLKGGTELFRRMPDARSFDLYNYREKDFPHFWWLNAQNFKGVETMSGRPCNVFHDTVMIGGSLHAGSEGAVAPDSEAGDAKAGLYLTAQPRKVTAYIDIETLQPLQLRIDAETRTFKYGAIPPTALVLPPPIQAELDAWIDLLQAANRPHKAP